MQNVNEKIWIMLKVISYIMYLYKDQEHNLFETICFDFLKLSEPIEKDGDTLKIARFYNNQFFHEYSRKEQTELADYIEQFHPSMADYIR